jgi:DNA-binding MarR family transcriptional regulator
MARKLEPHDLLVSLLLVQGLLDRQSEAFFQPYGLTGAQFNIINLLAHRGGRMNQLALVDMLLVGKSSISTVLNRIVRSALVRREEHPSDRRQTVLVLTTKGRALWKKISPRYEAIVRDVFGALPISRRMPLADDLRSLHHALLAREGIPRPEAGKLWQFRFVSAEKASL